MAWTRSVWARVRQLVARRATERRMDEEMRFHLDMETEKNIREGMSIEEASRQAVLAFGGVEKHKEGMRDGRRIPLLENLVQDTRYAARSLRRTPGFTITVVLTLAAGIGATTAMYGVMSRLLLLPPPHVMEPERVVKPYFTYDAVDRDPETYTGRDYAYFERVRASSRTLRSVGAYVQMDFPVDEGSDALQAKVTLATQGFWSVLGTRPALGRLFSDEEAVPIGGARVAVLGHAFWRRHYGGDPAVVGKTLRVKGHPYEIVGVTPRGFRGIELEETDVWLPIGAYADGSPDSLKWTETRYGFWLTDVGRLAPGATAAQAGAELSALTRSIDDEHARERKRPTDPETGTKSWVTAGPVVGALGRDMKRIPEARVAVWLVAIAGVLLAAACVNVASLLLLRAMRRRREIAVRVALGMGRGRMAAQLFTESLLLATVGGVVALTVAIAGTTWISRVLLPDLAWEPDSLDWRMLSLTGTCILGTALLAGLAPLLQTREDPARVLREGAQQGSPARSRVLRGLLATQIALSVVLLTGAGLFLRSLQRIDAVDLGFDRQHVLVATIDFSGTGKTRKQVGAFWEQALERVRAIPGVERASLSTTAPLRTAFGAGIFRLPEGTARVVKEQGMPTVNYVTPDFFATAGTRIVLGRDFRPEERHGAPTLVLNETLARVGWPGRSALGACIPFETMKGCATVIGVVANARRFDLREPEMLMYYLPLTPDDGGLLLVREAPRARLGAETLRRALAELDPNLPYLHVESLGTPLDLQIRPWRLGASVFTAFGVLAMLLAAVGLYSALAYAITQRTREIGIRLAIGARAGDVVRLVMRDGLRVALVGISVGLAACIVAGPWIADLLFEVGPRDGPVLVAVSALLLFVTLLASAGPIMRALRVDPTIAMRAE
jgi:putative ABC transport system permease protein